MRIRHFLLCIGLMLGSTGAAVAGPPSQMQVARQFLLAVLRADYTAAYGLLAPEVTQAVSRTQFQAAARSLQQAGQQYQPAFELYKFGLRLGEGDDVRRFYAFTFKADTLNAAPHVQLDVTFRDSAATRVLFFGLMPIKQPAPVPAARH
ncbi:hypothetical protein [Hymenobacter sp. BT730]|uniref:hypothetical protein n=1 Tax=Hymenobacter sp. BT730 TaxID=3063332 RepID=UPI0026DFA1A9|nr:hypothetical protein [Hymenobacter sp. BT730]